MSEQRVRIDPTKPLAAEAHVGHNRWHPAIPPIVTVRPGERLVLETRDAVDGQVTAATEPADLLRMNLNVAHPLTGPVHVVGAQPGDLLEVNVVGVEPDGFGYTSHLPGFGFLREHFPDPFVVKWRIAGGYAESRDLPGVRIRGDPFPGTIGVAPSPEQLQRIAAREQRLLDRGGAVFPPEPRDAVPSDPEIARAALRTIPPREFAGNLDVRQLSAGATLLVPVSVPGALFSIGDAHFAQGDGEVLGAAVEMRGAFHLEFGLRPGEAARRGMAMPAFRREVAAREGTRYYATTGISLTDGGESTSEDATLAAKRAVLAMIDHLAGERGYTREQAYAICSVAVDLRLSSVVNVPNFVVSAVLPLDIFV